MDGGAHSSWRILCRLAPGLLGEVLEASWKAVVTDRPPESLSQLLLVQHPLLVQLGELCLDLEDGLVELHQLALELLERQQALLLGVELLRAWLAGLEIDLVHSLLHWWRG